jgi:glycosyltransferase involved in cell wall biosynthesis
MNYGPNQDAVDWLTQEVWPLVIEIIPDARLRIVGGGGRRTFANCGPSVHFVGFVADMSVELSKADFAIVPLRSGSGTRIKILEAWANFIPVVSTTVGAEGLGATSGVDLLLADTAADLADAVFRLTFDHELRDIVVLNGRAKWESQFSPPAVAAVIQSIVTR